MPKRRKIALIGAGQIGGQLALLSLQRELGDVVLYDIPQTEGMPKGKALDIMHLGGCDGHDCNIIGTNNWEDIDGADVVIVTAGLPRKPGMSRDDLLEVNVKIMKEVAPQVKQRCKDAFIIVVSNPLDAMVYAMKKITGFGRDRVVGMAGVLDSSRFKYFVAAEAGVSVKDVQALVLGGHGDTMVPLLSSCNIAGIPVRKFISEDKLKAIADRTAKAGTEIVGLLKTGSAYTSPAACIIAMTEAYLRDLKRVFACAVYLEGEYGYKDLYMGVPCVIGAGGMERVIEVDLDAEEKAKLEKSANAVRSVVGDIKW